MAGLYPRCRGPGKGQGYTPPVLPLSAVLITQDEESNLPAALESLRFCDEIVVVDSGSTDRTRELAEAAGARVMVSAPWPGYVAQKNRALDEARHDWVLSLDADERVSDGLREEIQALRRDGPGHAGYRVSRMTHYLGRWIRGTDWYPDWQLRLFDRRRGRWQGALVHESVAVEGPVGRLRGILEHRPYRDAADHRRTIETYSALWAQQSRAAGRRTGPLEIYGAAAWSFFRNYVLKGGLLLGPAGWTVSRLNAYYTYRKLAALGELSREANRPR